MGRYNMASMSSGYQAYEKMRQSLPFINIRQGSQIDLILRRFVQNKLAVFGFLLTVFYLSISLIGPLFAPYDPFQLRVGEPFEPPSTTHWFGTDHLGRDVFSRVLEGGRLSILVGGAVVIASTIAGVTFGLIAGFFRGYVGAFIMRVVDVALTFPSVLLALVIVAILGPGLDRVILALSISYGIYMTRVARGSAVSIRENEYIMAAISYGERAYFLMFREMLPNMLSAVLVQATLIWAFAILAESTLSYLGLSAQPPTATWGIMVSEGQAVITIAPWAVIFPGFAIMISVLALTFLGVGLRDALDPHSETDIGGGGI